MAGATALGLPEAAAADFDSGAAAPPAGVAGAIEQAPPHAADPVVTPPRSAVRTGRHPRSRAQERALVRAIDPSAWLSRFGEVERQSHSTP